MLSSISQFIRDLPSPANVLKSQQDDDLDKKDQVPDTDISSATNSVVDHDESTRAEVKAERRRRRGTILYETFVVVRPPPAMSNHPLNLQLQLIPPSARETRRANQSTDTVDQANAQSMSNRSPSLRSNRSETSLYSAVSFNSTTASLTSSTASSGSSTRRIVPLYNLSAHNVMTNTITDAGTDAKVAKFGKRSIEVINLGLLECYEVIGVVIDQAQLQALMGSNIPNTVSSSQEGTSADVSKAPSIVTPSSSSSHLDESTTPMAGDAINTTPTPTTPVPSGARKIFGKMFRRRENVTPTPGNSLSPVPAPPSPTPNGSFFRSKRTPSHSDPIPPVPETPTTALPVPSGILQPPCLGTQATLLYRTPSREVIIPPSTITALVGRATLSLQRTRSQRSLVVPEEGALPTSPVPIRRSIDRSLHPPTTGTIPLPVADVPPPPLGYRRTSHSYEWVMRRWVKGADSGLFGIKDTLLSAKSAVFRDADLLGAEGNPTLTEVEVRFEWVKGKGSKARARERRRTGTQTEAEDFLTTGEQSNYSSVGSRKGREERGRRKSMAEVRNNDDDPFVADPSEPFRPASLFVTGTNRSATSLTPPTGRDEAEATTERRKSVRSTKEKSPSGRQHASTLNVGSPKRPSIDSSRQSSGSDGATSSQGHHGDMPPGGTVFKGERSKRRTGSTAGREPSASTMMGMAQPLPVEDDEETDAEDSETPWVCTLYVGPPLISTVLAEPQASQQPLVSGSRIKPSNTSISGSRSAFITGSASMVAESGPSGGHRRFPSSASAQISLASPTTPTFVHRRAATTGVEVTGIPEEKPKPVKLKVATLTPAPHHPKVVSQLKMPFPIPDINVTRMKIYDSSDEMASDRSPKGGDLILTMEEIKDVVCVTGLWLVVREGFGGLERPRKGDGWKLRG